MATAAVGGALLIIALFLDWYQFTLPAQGGRPSRDVLAQNAWEGLERTDVYICILAVAALIALVVLIGNWVRDSNAVQFVIVLVGLAAAFLVLYRGFNPPAPVVFGVELDTSLKFGWFLALLSSALIAVGGSLTVVRRPAAEREASAPEPEAGPTAPAEPEPRAQRPRADG